MGTAPRLTQMASPSTQPGHSGPAGPSSAPWNPREKPAPSASPSTIEGRKHSQSHTAHPPSTQLLGPSPPNMDQLRTACIPPGTCVRAKDLSVSFSYPSLPTHTCRDTRARPATVTTLFQSSLHSQTPSASPIPTAPASLPTLCRLSVAITGPARTWPRAARSSCAVTGALFPASGRKPTAKARAQELLLTGALQRLPPPPQGQDLCLLLQHPEGTVKGPSPALMPGTGLSPTEVGKAGANTRTGCCGHLPGRAAAAAAGAARSPGWPGSA